MSDKDNMPLEVATLASDVIHTANEREKNWKHAFIISTIIGAVTTLSVFFGFLHYLSQYDFESSVEQTGVYTYIDSNGNVISSDLSPTDIESIMEVIQNGKTEGNKEANEK